MDFTKLVKGKLLDAQPGFVDSWNRMVDCWNNLFGKNSASVGWDDDFHPYVDVTVPKSDDDDDDDDSDSDEYPDLPLPPFDAQRPQMPRPFDVTVTTTNGTSSATFANQFYRVGGKTYQANLGAIASVASCIAALKIAMTGASPTATLETYADLSALQSAETNESYYILPLYKFDGNGAVECDLRGAMTAAAGEF